jgi:hypothetical protein
LQDISVHLHSQIDANFQVEHVVVQCVDELEQKDSDEQLKEKKQKFWKVEVDLEVIAWLSGRCDQKDVHL